MPFERLAGLPGELARGNLIVPLKENRNRFFGQFVWGMDMLRSHFQRLNCMQKRCRKAFILTRRNRCGLRNKLTVKRMR